MDVKQYHVVHNVRYAALLVCIKHKSVPMSPIRQKGMVQGRQQVLLLGSIMNDVLHACQYSLNYDAIQQT